MSKSIRSSLLAAHFSLLIIRKRLYVLLVIFLVFHFHWMWGVLFSHWLADAYVEGGHRTPEKLYSMKIVYTFFLIIHVNVKEPHLDVQTIYSVHFFYFYIYFFNFNFLMSYLIKGQ